VTTHEVPAVRVGAAGRVAMAEEDAAVAHEGCDGNLMGAAAPSG
jgi:hypothetical protein